MRNWSGQDWFGIIVASIIVLAIAREIFVWFIGVGETNQKLDKIIKLLEKRDKNV